MNIKIMRGPSGAGKSTYIHNHWDEWGKKVKVVSADRFFINIDGDYVFDPKNLGTAHAWCLRNFANALSEWVDYSQDAEYPDDTVLVVDNTNLSAVEVAPYYQLAVAYGIPVEIIDIYYDPDTYPNRNTHGVPVAKVKQMFDRGNRELRNFPPYWKITHINPEGV
jgi:hypothetical protein